MEPKRYCPVCCKVYIGLSQHLRRFHQICNKEERQLLLSWSSGRVDIREEACPIPCCLVTSTARLDRHMLTHTELSNKARSLALNEVRRKVTIRKLGELREVNPAVQMVTRFDLGEIQLSALGAAGEAPPVLSKEQCWNEGCKSTITTLKAKVDHLTRSLAAERKRHRLLLKKLQGPLGRTQRPQRRSLCCCCVHRAKKEEVEEAISAPI